MLTNKCHSCDRTFTKPQHLKRHQRAHTGERPFRCKVCGKRFARRDVLLRHSRAHVSQDAIMSYATTCSSPMGPTEEQVHGPHQGSLMIFSNPAPPECDNDESDPGRSSSDQESFPFTPSQDLLAMATNVVIDSDMGAFEDPETTNEISSNLSQFKCQSSQLESQFQPQCFGGQGSDCADNGGVLNPLDSLVHLGNLSAAFEFPEISLDTLPANDCDEASGWPYMTEKHGQASGTHPQPGLPVVPPEVFHLLLNQVDTQSPSGLSKVSCQTNTSGLSEAERSAEKVKHERPERLWPTRPRRAAPLISSLWRDIGSCGERNLLSQTSEIGQDNSPIPMRNSGVDTAGLLFDKLKPFIRNLRGCSCPPGLSDMVMQDSNPTSDCGKTRKAGEMAGRCQECRKSSELLNLGLEQYKRKFHTLIPIVHIPTFKPEETTPILLFVICLLGLAFVNTEEAVAFGARGFPTALETVYAEVSSTAFGDVGAERRMCMFATSGLMLALVILTGEHSFIEKTRLLYVNTLTAARQHGLFTPNFCALSDIALPEPVSGDELQWLRWSRVESAKRILICLLLADSWFSEYFSTGPILCADYIHLSLPCDAVLFQAPNANAWIRLKESNCESTTLTFTLSSRNSNFPIFQKSIDSYSIKAILCSVLLRIYDSYHYLFSSADVTVLLKNQYVPWRVFSLDEKARATVGLVLEIINTYGNAMERAPSDCLVIWHQMGLLLTTNCYLLEDAVGRYGNEASSDAMGKIKVWAQTPAARRGCIHAAQAFKVMTCRRPLDSGFQSPNHLFHAALVLGLYILNSPVGVGPHIGGEKAFELLGDIDWKAIGTEGLSEIDSQCIIGVEDPAVNFIRFGGAVSLNGEVCSGGVRSAQRVLLDFASLLDDMKKWKIGDYSRLLYMISENLGGLASENTLDERR